MNQREEVLQSFKSGLKILETTLSGLEVPFRVIEHLSNDKIDYAKIDINGNRFFIVPDANGVRLWIADFPIKNTDGTKFPPGFIGFPSEVAGIINRYYMEMPKGPFQTLDGVGTISLNEIVREEVKKVFEDYDFAAQEREYNDRMDYEEVIEAEVSSALSFVQDIRSSIKSIEGQIGLGATGEVVDQHLKEAVKHMNGAINSYFETLSPEVKDQVVNRLGEIKIGK